MLSFVFFCEFFAFEWLVPIRLGTIARDNNWSLEERRRLEAAERKGGAPIEILGNTWQLSALVGELILKEKTRL